MQRIMPFERMVERLMEIVPPLLDAPRSLMKGEATQVVRYRKGESYAKHFDIKNGNVAQVLLTQAYLCIVGTSSPAYTLSQ